MLSGLVSEDAGFAAGVPGSLDPVTGVVFINQMGIGSPEPRKRSAHVMRIY